MRKSLAIIASALLLAVGAATHDRLRYDSTVFNDVRVTGGGASAKRVEYPACIKGVREDRCIQLYERGVKRSYQRWLAANGRGDRSVASRSGARAYPPCRGRSDDRCQQRASSRQARVARQAPTRQVQRRAAARQQVARRAAVRRVQATAPARVTRAAARTQARTQPRITAVQQQQRTRTAAPVRRPPSNSGTPGI
jgi:hypothetical protein